MKKDIKKNENKKQTPKQKSDKKTTKKFEKLGEVIKKKWLINGSKTAKDGRNHNSSPSIY